MSDAAAAVHRRSSEELAQAGDASRELAGLYASPIQDGHPSGVISAVFQSRQPLDQN